MASQFIKLVDVRIRTTAIKKYKPTNTNKLLVYYSPSTQKTEFETITFPTNKERDNMVEQLDSIFL